jgi:hypothetical protein
MNYYADIRDWGFNSVVECWPSMQKAQGSILSTTKIKPQLGNSGSRL